MRARPPRPMPPALVALPALSALLALLAACGEEPRPAPYYALDAGAGAPGFLHGDTGSSPAGDGEADHDGSPASDGGRPPADATASIDTDAAPETAEEGCPGGCDDGLACTKDLCKEGYCVVEPLAGYCITAGKCWPTGPVPVPAGDPLSCRVCEPSKAVFALSKADGGACDDGDPCTAGDTCQQGQCVGAPGPGCCHADADCKAPEACQLGICNPDKGSCSFIPKPGCCTSGLCCDPGAQLPKPPGSPCAGPPLRTEWGCDGARIRRRLLKPGCDGSSPSACSGKLEDATPGPWETVKTCPAPKVCVPAADPSAPPQCGDAGACKEDSACNDGRACTIDKCVAGTCQHPAAAKGAACGVHKELAQYRCDPAKPGRVQARFATALCDGGPTCPEASGQSFTAWVTFHDCLSGGCEDDGKPTTIPQCAEPPDCKAGSTCCTSKGTWAAQGSKCDDKAARSEYRCVGTAGGRLEKRNAYPGCSGKGASCTALWAQYLAWGPWTLVKQCKTDFKCQLGYSGGKCIDAKECKPGTTCCDDKGFFRAVRTKCDAAPVKTRTRCGADGKAIEERRAFPGCSGKGTTCYKYTSDYYAWTPWAKTWTCSGSSTCKEGWNGARCQGGQTECAPGTTCCTPAGTRAPRGYKCGSYPIKTRYKCTSSGKGGEILRRRGYRGCAGKSASCSSQDADLAWEAWQSYDTCQKYERCAISTYYGGQSASCKDVSKCSPAAPCCTEAGEFEKAASKCGSYAIKTEYKCSSAEPGGDLLERQTFAGCTGASGYGCSSQAAWQWVGPWKVAQDCPANRYCFVAKWSRGCAASKPK